jgi:hypothetical protein
MSASTLCLHIRRKKIIQRKCQKGDTGEVRPENIPDTSGRHESWSYRPNICELSTVSLPTQQDEQLDSKNQESLDL